jgi:hypothetical protein
MTMMTASSSLDGIETRKRNLSVWRKFLDTVLETRTQNVEHEIAEFLQRHTHDLPPQMLIELQRRMGGP